MFKCSVLSALVLCCSCGVLHHTYYELIHSFIHSFCSLFKLCSALALQLPWAWQQQIICSHDNDVTIGGRALGGLKIILLNITISQMQTPQSLDVYLILNYTISTINLSLKILNLFQVVHLPLVCLPPLAAPDVHSTSSQATLWITSNP